MGPLWNADREGTYHLRVALPVPGQWGLLDSSSHTSQLLPRTATAQGSVWGQDGPGCEEDRMCRPCPRPSAALRMRV